MLRNKLPAIIGLAIALVMQALIAPAIQVGYALPNFVLSYIVALAIADKGSLSLGIAFIGGLLYDLIGTEPVGIMPLVCVIAMFGCSYLSRIADRDGILMPILMIVVSCLVLEIIHGLLVMACGIDVGLLDALAFRMLPCALYDMFIAVIAYLLVVRFASTERDPGMMMIDNGVDR